MEGQRSKQVLSKQRVAERTDLKNRERRKATRGLTDWKEREWQGTLILMMMVKMI